MRGKTAFDPGGDDLNDMDMKSLVMHKGTVNLQDFMRWYVYAKMVHKLIDDPEQMFTLCEAEMTPGGASRVTLSGTRMVMNRVSGELEHSPYADLVTQVGAHTGYELSGHGGRICLNRSGSSSGLSAI